MKARKASSNGRRARGEIARPHTLRNLTDDLLAQEEQLRQGGGPAGHERQRRLGRLPVRQRLSLLLDADTPFLELNLWVAWGMYPEAGSIPAAGVVTGVGFVHGRPCMVIANDATVKAGAFFPATVKKVLRAQRIAGRCNLPLLYLVDSAGVYLPMQDEIFPDEDDFGRIFRNNAVLSAQGVPQYAAIMGNCVAGGAYLPVLCDKVLMTKDSELYIAGPSLVKAAIGQEVDAKALGGARLHAGTSGTVDFAEPNDTACLQRLRSLVDLLPPAPTHRVDAPAPELPPEHVYDLISLGGSRAYNARELLECLVDAGSLLEYKADYGHSLVCAYAAIGGHKVSVIANQHVVTRTPQGEAHVGGVIYPDAADKAARFVMDCTQTGLPLLFIQDVMGFMVGPAVEAQGVIRRGAKLVSAVSNSTAPKITLIVGGSFGAGNYALCGKAFDPTFVFAWPGARYAVMGAAQAAATILDVRRRHDQRDGRARGEAELQELYESIRATYEQQTDIRYGAARGWVDAIIAPHATRDVLALALRLATRPPPPGGFRAGVFQV
jgi:acetyl-CoA carboxylase carboxyltransferase component